MNQIRSLHPNRILRQSLLLAWLAGLPIFSFSNLASAQVQSVGENGFEIRVSKTTVKTSQDISRAFIGEIGKWWSPDHSWSGKAENLSIDLERAALIETLPDGGFCRHMQLEHFQPGKLILLTGGLGPLKEMGLKGALTIRFSTQADQTRMDVKYIVSGYSATGFKELAPVVHQVLNQQMERCIAYCETGSPQPQTGGQTDK